MATCEKCLHNGVCSIWRAAEGRDASNYTVGGDGASGCRGFLDQSRFAEVPCQAGDTVWCISSRKVKKANVRSVHIERNATEVWMDFECDYDCMGCPFAAWAQSVDGDWDCQGEYGETAVTADYFGKTVFFTREEAENAFNQNNEKVLNQNKEERHVH